MTMTAVPTPKSIARNLPRNQGRVGQTIVYRDPFTTVISEMLIEGTAMATDGVHTVYIGAGRTIHSRHVHEVR